MGRSARGSARGRDPARATVELDEGELELFRKLVRHHFGNPHDEPRDPSLRVGAPAGEVETLEGLLVKIQRAFLELGGAGGGARSAGLSWPGTGRG